MKIILKIKIENNLILIEFENSLKLREGVSIAHSDIDKLYRRD